MIAPIANKTALLSFLKENSGAIRAYGVNKLSLFGSFVRDKGITKKSDIDFIVEFKKGQHTFRNLMDLGYFLEDNLGRKVEVITRAALRPPIGPEILKTSEDVSF